jgi:hypothetical protein
MENMQVENEKRLREWPKERVEKEQELQQMIDKRKRRKMEPVPEPVVSEFAVKCFPLLNLPKPANFFLFFILFSKCKFLVQFFPVSDFSPHDTCFLFFFGSFIYLRRFNVFTKRQKYQSLIPWQQLVRRLLKE